MHVNKVLTPYGLQLYLYLASNLNDYQFALSPAAAEEDAGIRSTSFHKYFRLLEIEGYVVWRHGNVFDFYPTPRPANERTHPDKHCNFISFATAVGARGKQHKLLRIRAGKQIENAGNRLTEPIRGQKRIVMGNTLRESRTCCQQYASGPSSLLLHSYHQKSKSGTILLLTIKRKSKKNAANYGVLDTV